MSAAVNNIAVVEAELDRLGANVRAELAGKIHDLAEEVAVRMKRLVPKGPGSGLVNAIKARQVGDLAWEVFPEKDYARYVEDGIKPGGKGLPPYLTQGGRSILEWLDKTPPNGGTRKHKPRKGSKAFDAATAVMRDRYFGMAQHIRQFGVKAQQFVKQTYDEMQPLVRSRLEAAVRAAMAASAQLGGSA